MSDAAVRPAPLLSPDWDDTRPFGEAPIHPQHDHAYCWQALYEDGTSLWEVAGGQYHVLADIDQTRVVALRLVPVQPGFVPLAVQTHRTQPSPDGTPPTRDDRTAYFRRTFMWDVPLRGEDGPVSDAVRRDWHIIGWERPDGSGAYLYVSPEGLAFLSDSAAEV